MRCDNCLSDATLTIKINVDIPVTSALTVLSIGERNVCLICLKNIMGIENK